VRDGWYRGRGWLQGGCRVKRGPFTEATESQFSVVARGGFGDLGSAFLA
jgi:hypothetical protein